MTCWKFEKGNTGNGSHIRTTPYVWSWNLGAIDSIAAPCPVIVVIEIKLAKDPVSGIVTIEVL